MPVEHRVLEIEEIEIRASGESQEQRFVSGVGIVYNKEVEIWPGFREKIRNGAFSDTLKSGAEVKSFFNHDPNQVLATTKSNPALTIEDTDKGMRFEAPIPPTTYGKDLEINLDRKNVRGASFSFSVDDEGDIVTRDEKGVYHREIVKATIYEIGPVTNPAYPQTKVGLRSAEESYNEIQNRYKESENVVDTSDIELRKKSLYLLERGL